MVVYHRNDGFQTSVRRRLQPPQPGHRPVSRDVVACSRQCAGASRPRCDPPGNRRARFHHRSADCRCRPGGTGGRPHPLHRRTRAAGTTRGDCRFLCAALRMQRGSGADSDHTRRFRRVTAGQQPVGRSGQALATRRPGLPLQPALSASGRRRRAAGAGRRGHRLSVDPSAGGDLLEQRQRRRLGGLAGKPNRQRALSLAVGCARRRSMPVAAIWWWTRSTTA